MAWLFVVLVEKWITGGAGKPGGCQPPVVRATVLVMVLIIVITPFRHWPFAMPGRHRGRELSRREPGICKVHHTCRERCDRRARPRSLNAVRLPEYTKRAEKGDDFVTDSGDRGFWLHV
jgi:hypothetical protein